MISLIFAIAEDNLIGKDNDLPWNYQEDLRYFRNVTKGKTVVMGKNTFLSIYNRIGKPLANRTNVVVTNDKNFNYNDIVIVNDFKSYIMEAKTKEEEIFIIGGKMIYELSLEYADRLYITHIHKKFDGNVYFPRIPYDQFIKIKSNIGVNSPELEFAIYERRGK